MELCSDFVIRSVCVCFSSLNHLLSSRMRKANQSAIYRRCLALFLSVLIIYLLIELQVSVLLSDRSVALRFSSYLFESPVL